MQRFVIVKHGSKDVSHHYFAENPRKGVEITASAHESYTGENVGIKPFYEDKTLAIEDCHKMNEYNPTGQYEVCPVIE